MTELTFSFEDFLKWEEADHDTLKVKRIYIDIAGDLIAGILLSQIIYWHLPSKRDGQTKLRVKKDGQLWLAKGREDWWDECRITPRQFDRAVKILVDKGIVEKKIFKFDGSPTIHVRLVSDVLMNYIEAELNGEQDEQGEMDFNKRGKSKLTKGENPNQQKGKIQINERGKSLTETTTEITTEITADDNEQPQKNKDDTNPYSFYEQNFGMLTPHIADRIRGMEEDIGETMVLIAMQEAIECGAFNIRYVETVVNSWLKNNITTPQAYMMHKTKHTAKKQRSKDSNKESRHIPSADETAEYLRKLRGDRNAATAES